METHDCKFSYKDDYAYDDDFQQKYGEYQEKYFDSISERDKFLMRLVGDVLQEKLTLPNKETSLLDIGCSTGSFLYHLKSQYPSLNLVGGDASPSIVDRCKSDPRLEGISFDVMDILELAFQDRVKFDIVVANAVAVYFSNDAYVKCVQSVAESLQPGGWYLGFEWLHPYDQDLTIFEKSASHPNGLEIHFRPYSFVKSCFQSCGFSNIEFFPSSSVSICNQLLMRRVIQMNLNH